MKDRLTENEIEPKGDSFSYYFGHLVRAGGLCVRPARAVASIFTINTRRNELVQSGDHDTDKLLQQLNEQEKLITDSSDYKNGVGQLRSN